MKLEFTVFIRAEPQGSTKAFVIPGTNRACITSANAKMKPFRSELTRMARATVSESNWTEPLHGKHQPVTVTMIFGFRKPDSTPKTRNYPSVKPDIDKLTRAVLDALTGVAFKDDGQVVTTIAHKVYCDVEFVTVTVEPKI